MEGHSCVEFDSSDPSIEYSQYYDSSTKCSESLLIFSSEKYEWISSFTILLDQLLAYESMSQIICHLKIIFGDFIGSKKKLYSKKYGILTFSFILENCRKMREKKLMKNSRKSTLLPHWGRWWHQSVFVDSHSYTNAYRTAPFVPEGKGYLLLITNAVTNPIFFIFTQLKLKLN